MAYFGRAAVFSKSVLPRPLAAFGSVHRPGRRFVCELGGRIPDPAPDRYAVVIVGGCQLIGARFAFLERLLAIALEHQVGGAPDIDLGSSRGKNCTLAVYKSLTPQIALLAKMRVRVAAKWRGYCNGPGGIWFASWPTASAIRRQTVAPL